MNSREELLGGAAELAERVFASAPEVGGDEAPHAVLHGLCWLVVNLTQSFLIVLAVDDVHWADGPSLRFLIPSLDVWRALPSGS